MPSFNQVILVGHLTRDPQIKHLPSGMKVAEFGIATNHKYRTGQGEDREEVCFVDCSAFGKQAEAIGNFLHKGKAVLIVGRLKMDSWEDKQSGAKRTKHTIVVDNFRFMGGKDDGGDGDSGARPQARQSQQRTTGGSRQQSPADAAFDAMGVQEEDCPF